MEELRTKLDVIDNRINEIKNLMNTLEKRKEVIIRLLTVKNIIENEDDDNSFHTLAISLINNAITNKNNPVVN
jgi:hypothetical protein